MRWIWFPVVLSSPRQTIFCKGEDFLNACCIWGFRFVISTNNEQINFLLCNISVLWTAYNGISPRQGLLMLLGISRTKMCKSCNCCCHYIKIIQGDYLFTFMYIGNQHLCMKTSNRKNNYIYMKSVDHNLNIIDIGLHCTSMYTCICLAKLQYFSCDYFMTYKSACRLSTLWGKQQYIHKSQ